VLPRGDRPRHVAPTDADLKVVAHALHHAGRHRRQLARLAVKVLGERLVVHLRVVDVGDLLGAQLRLVLLQCAAARAAVPLFPPIHGRFLVLPSRRQLVQHPP
jgi:hypothetical protein